MQQTVQFSGIIPPVSTIFTADGQLDKPGFAALIDDTIAAGVDGLFFLGSGGEFSQLNADERKAIAAFAIAHVDRRVPVLIGTGGTNARETIELSQQTPGPCALQAMPKASTQTSQNVFAGRR